MQKLVAAGTFAALLIGGAAWAQPAAYTWTGMGTAVDGSSKCATYKMTVDLSVDGKTVKGLIHQQGRPERPFEATLGAGGAFKTKAEVGGGGTIEITGTVSDQQSRVLLDGYCKFEGRLTRTQ